MTIYDNPLMVNFMKGAVKMTVDVVCFVACKDEWALDARKRNARSDMPLKFDIVMNDCRQTA
jgi:hypothetical protein